MRLSRTGRVPAATAGESEIIEEPEDDQGDDDDTEERADQRGEQADDLADDLQDEPDDDEGEDDLQEVLDLDGGAIGHHGGRGVPATSVLCLPTPSRPCKGSVLCPPPRTCGTVLSAIQIQTQADPAFGVPLTRPAVRLVLAALLGLFLGLEREWSDMAAGIRTFSLTSLAGAVFTIVAVETGFEGLLLVGGAFVVVQSVLLAARGLVAEDALKLTTSVSLLVAYGVGALVAAGFVLGGVTVAVVSSLLLVLKRELHDFADALTREELRSVTEFAILAFVVFPLLPAEPVTVRGVGVEPRVAWLMVVTIAGIGIANYAVVRSYGGLGVVATGFFGGLASSTAVVGSMLGQVRRRPELESYAVAAVLLAEAAMALRNLAIALAFSFPAVLVRAVVPLGVFVGGAVVVALRSTDWDESVDLDLDSPFSLRNALAFGAVFLAILAVGTVAQTAFGTAGLYASSFVSGLVSSAGATTTAVLLYRSGSVSASVAVVAVLLATAASVVVKAGLALAGPRSFARRVARWSALLLVVSGAATLLVTTV